jgi:hypothetical protein
VIEKRAGRKMRGRESDHIEARIGDTVLGNTVQTATGNLGLVSRGLTRLLEAALSGNSAEVHGERSKRCLPFRATDLKRAIRALQSVGINPTRVEIEPDGKIVVINDGAAAVSDNALDRWMARHADSA